MAESQAVATPGKDDRETPFEWISSFVGFFVYLLVLKGFFLPLFMIPTGSMAESLYGEHSVHTCRNCGMSYTVGFSQDPRFRTSIYQCPNCHWRVHNRAVSNNAPDAVDEVITERLSPAAGDRIALHGWPFDRPFSAWPGLGPQRWDVVVFKVPSDGETNYIKRLIGLPGEKIEIIDGDIWVNDRIAKKTAEAQGVLWIPFFRQDYLPMQPSLRKSYFPRWLPIGRENGWSGLRSRVFRFGDEKREQGEIAFATDARENPPAATISDDMPYNGGGDRFNPVSDVRLSAEVHFDDDEGYVELSMNKRQRRFVARLSRDGHVTLRQEPAINDTPVERREVGAADIGRVAGPTVFSLGIADYDIVVSVDGRAVVTISSTNYPAELSAARDMKLRAVPSAPRIAAADGKLSLRHVEIDRDVYYTSFTKIGGRLEPVAVEGKPITLASDEYLMLGDNTRASLDSRFSFSQGEELTLGPPLRGDANYHPGTVRADQLMGRAFLVYWPGFKPLPIVEKSVLPDLGHVRWIH